MSKVLGMLTNAAGPEGSWSAGYEYLVPDNLPMPVAEGLVTVGAAQWLEGQSMPVGPSPGGKTRTEGPAPEVDEEDVSEEEDDAKDE